MTAPALAASPGLLRQIRQNGFTTSGGGLYSVKYVKSVIREGSIFVQKQTATGEYMSALENTQVQIDGVTDAIAASGRKLTKVAEETTKHLNDVNAKLREGTDRLAGAMDKFAKVTNNTNFAKTAETAQSLVESLERLAVLQRTGQLDKLLAALSSK